MEDVKMRLKCPPTASPTAPADVKGRLIVASVLVSGDGTAVGPATPLFVKVAPYTRPNLASTSVGKPQ